MQILITEKKKNYRFIDLYKQVQFLILRHKKKTLHERL